MMDAKMQLFVNKHFMVDKCEKCIKLPDAYEYCDVVNEKHQTLLKEYDAVGPKIDMAICSECMGSGEFTIRNLDGSYLTQEEYDKKHKKN